MEYTVTFTKYHMKTGKETLFETKICSDDTTAIKRAITKMAKTIEPFAKLQKECPTFMGDGIPMAITVQTKAITKDGANTCGIAP